MATPLVPANVPHFLPSLPSSLACSLSDLFLRAGCPVPAQGFAQLEGSMSPLWKGGRGCNKLLLNILLPLFLISVPFSNAPPPTSRCFDLHVILRFRSPPFSHHQNLFFCSRWYLSANPFPFDWTKGSRSFGRCTVVALDRLHDMFFIRFIHIDCPAILPGWKLGCTRHVLSFQLLRISICMRVCLRLFFSTTTKQQAKQK